MRHLGDFGPKLGAKGSPKIALLGTVGEKSDEKCEIMLKNLVSEAFWKKVENLMKSWCANGAIERVILWFSLEASSKTLAVSGSEHLMILGFQSDFKNHENQVKSDFKIGLGAVGGRIFEILGDFLRGLIFDEISIGKKSGQNMQKLGRNWKK